MMLKSIISLVVALPIFSLSTPVNSPCPLRPTPSYNFADAVFTVCSSNTIDAPPFHVYKIVRDFCRYKLWNQFVVDASVVEPGPLRVGDTLNFTVAGFLPNGGTITTYETVTVLEPLRTRIAWKYNAPPGSTYNSEHVTKITLQPNGQSLAESWETYYGPGAADLEAQVGSTIQSEFQIQGQNLKTYAESLDSYKILPICQ